MTAAEEKKALRARMLSQRSGIDMGTYRKLCNAVYENTKNLTEFKRAGRVHLYVSSIANEVDTLGLLFSLFDEGKTVVVPKCGTAKHELHHIRIRALDELRPGKYGLMEPVYRPENEMSPSSLDLVLAPLVAFDRNGGRLGMGGGYYDAFLKEVKCTVAGLAYSFQEVDSVPVEEHDAGLDIIITEKEIIRVSHE